MSYGSSSSNKKMDTKVYVGNLPREVRGRELEDLFFKYGKIIEIDLKDKREGAPPFAFIDFEDPRDAQDAIDDKDGEMYKGNKLRVELPRGGRGGFRGGFDRDRDRDYDSHGGGGYRGGGYRGRGGYNDFRGGGGGGRGGGPARRTDNRVIVKNLPPTGSWQDLKDHMREAGDVAFADVYKDGTGTVEYQRYDDMKYAVEKLNNTKFNSHEGEVSTIKVEAARDSGGSGSGSYSRKYSRSRSRSYSPKRRPTRGSPSYKPSKRYSRSPSPY